jgi:HEAT repeat protein
MKKVGIVFFATLFVVFSAHYLIAQDNGNDGTAERTIEELYLQNAEMSVIRQQAVTVDREMKLLALDNMEQLIEEGKVNEDSADALYLLDYLAMEGIAREVRVNGRLINYFPEVRRRAANLLGKVGGETAKDTLLDVIDNDNEPMVLAEAAYALGEIGINNDDQVALVLADMITQQSVVAPDDNLAFAVLLAFEKIAEANEGLNNPDVFNAIIQIAQGNYIREVRRKALDVMNKMRSYSQ